LPFRRREPRLLPRDLEPAIAERVAVSQGSARDRAIVTLLLRTGQRIGDWSGEHGRHGVLGMRVADVDRRRRTITVLLKGARDEHRVPVTDDWWPLLDSYLTQERGAAPSQALWVGRRQAAGRPLRYSAFEASFRAAVSRIGVSATPHMLRHTVAQLLVDVAGAHVAQEVLGHRNISTTIEEYTHVNEAAMLDALVEVARRQQRAHLTAVTHSERYAFDYSPSTIAALDSLQDPHR
jgi:integrase/recombinase XerD